MQLEEALEALARAPDGAKASQALGQLVHDLNTQLGGLVLSLDTLDRLSAVLAELGRRRQDPVLEKASARLDETSQVLGSASTEMQRILQAVADTADALRR